MRELLINEQIRDREVRLIGEDGTQYGIISVQEARQIAYEKGLDLCKVNDAKDNNPATCKLMDYGRYRFEQIKREKEAKKNQKITEIKEIKLSAVIDVGDLQRLANQTRKFIEEGNKVRVSIRFRGRQLAHPEIGINIMKKYFELVGETAIVERQPEQADKILFAVVAPAPVKK